MVVARGLCGVRAVGYLLTGKGLNFSLIYIKSRPCVDLGCGSTAITHCYFELSYSSIVSNVSLRCRRLWHVVCL